MEGILDIVNNKLNYNNKQIFMILDENNEPWFKAKDVAEVLEYQNIKQTLRINVDNDDKLAYNTIPKGGSTYSTPFNMQPNTVFINESGLYSLIFNSKKEEAKKFKKWVTSEVLPTIRKTGEYKLKKQIENLERRFIFALNTTRKIINKKDKEIDNLNNKIKNIKLDVVPKTKNENLKNYFILIKLNDENCDYDYYVIRCQKINLKRIYDKIILEHQNCTELLNFYNPNSINFYNRMKEKFAETLNFHGNYFRINDDIEITEKELIKQILNLNN